MSKIYPDPLDADREAKVDAQIAASEEREELRMVLCEALGATNLKTQQSSTQTFADWPCKLPWNWQTSLKCEPDRFHGPIPPLDHNLIAEAREKLLNTPRLKDSFIIALRKCLPPEDMDEIDMSFRFICATQTQQARAIIAAVKGNK